MTINRRIQFDRVTKDYAAFVSIDNEPEQLVGFGGSYLACEVLINNYVFDLLSSHTPEAAAALVMAGVA